MKWEEWWRGERRRRVKLPTYPFERVRCWIDADQVSRNLKFPILKFPILNILQILSSRLKMTLYNNNFTSCLSSSNC